MKKRPYKGRPDLIDPIPQAEDQNNCRNYRPSDFHKMTEPTEDSPGEEASQEASQEGEASPEEGASQAEEDIWEEEECHLGDHQEAVGDHHRCQCHKPIKGSS